MMDFLKRIFGMMSDDNNGHARSRGDIAYDRAMSASSDLLYRIREAGRETDAARELMADIWAQARNTPFMATVYEAVQEAKSGPEMMRSIPIVMNGRGHRRQ